MHRSLYLLLLLAGVCVLNTGKRCYNTKCSEATKLLVRVAGTNKLAPRQEKSCDCPGDRKCVSPDNLETTPMICLADCKASETCAEFLNSSSTWNDLCYCGVGLTCQDQINPKRKQCHEKLTYCNNVKDTCWKLEKESFQSCACRYDYSCAVPSTNFTTCQKGM